MPVVATRANASAFGLGWTALSAGAPYFIGVIGTTSDDAGQAVRVDSDGNMYVLSDTFSLNAGRRSAVLCKIAPDLSFVWRRQFLGSGANWNPESLEIDSSGNIYVGGFQYNSSTSLNDSVVMKLDSSGSIVWQKYITYNGGSGVLIYNNNYITTDSSGNVEVFGWPFNTWRFYTRLNSSGTVTSRGYTIVDSGSGDEAAGMRRLPNGNLVHAGQYSGLNSSGFQSNPFVQWFTTSGTVSTASLSISTGSWMAISSDASSNVYVGGWYSSGSVYGSRDTLVAKYNSSRNLSWQRTFGGSYEDQCYGVGADSAGNVYAVGRESHTTTAYRAFIVKYNSSGTVQWQRYLEGPRYTWFDDIQFDSNDDLIVSGFYNTSAADAIIGAKDTFIAKLPKDGSGTGTYTLNGRTITYGVGTMGTSTISKGTGSSGAGWNFAGAYQSVSNSALTEAANTNFQIVSEEV